MQCFTCSVVPPIAADFPKDKVVGLCVVGHSTTQFPPAAEENVY